MMQSTVAPPTLACTVTPPSPAVVGSGNVACWSGSGPRPLPVIAKSAPWAMPENGDVLWIRLPAFTTLPMVTWAAANPVEARKRKRKDLASRTWPMVILSQDPVKRAQVW